MPLHDDYSSLKEAVESAGFFTTFQPIRAPGDRIVCASHSYTTGPRAGALGGNSFWVAKRRGEWFIATWAPVIYRVSDPDRLTSLSLRLLQRQPAKAYSEFDQQFCTEFGLVAIPEEEFVD